MNPLDTLKNIGEVLRKADKIPEYQLIIEVQQKLFDLQRELENAKDETEKLKESLELKGKVLFEKKSYWEQKENGDKDGPFCTRCWEKHKYLIRLQESPAGVYDLMCPDCKNGIRG